MGDGRTDLDAADVKRALALYRVACIVQALAVIIALLLPLAWL